MDNNSEEVAYDENGEKIVYVKERPLAKIIIWGLVITFAFVVGLFSFGYYMGAQGKLMPHIDKGIVEMKLEELQNKPLETYNELEKVQSDEQN